MTRKTAWVAFALLAFSSMTGSCGCESKREQSLRSIYSGDHARADDAAPVVDPALEGLQPAQLSYAPSSDSLRSPPPERAVPLMRVVLTPSVIRIDDSELVSFVSERLPETEEGEEHLVPFELPLEARTHEVAWPDEKSGYHINALRDAAAEIRDAATTYAGSDSMPSWVLITDEDEEILDRRVFMYVDRSLPYEKVASAVYSLGMAGVKDIAIWVEAAQGGVLLPLNLPAVCDGLSEAPVPCTYLVFTSVQSGLHATAWAAAQSGDGCVAMADAALEGDASPSWHGLQVLGEGGSCPPVRRAASGIDRAALDGLLEEVAKLGPICSSATILAPPDQAWQPVAEALAALVESDRKVALGADTEFSRMVLDEDWYRCEGGFRPEE